MIDCEPFTVLGSPDVRNAILLNEIGVLIHDLGKLNEEFISGRSAFPHNLILRRLTRGKDPHLGSDPRSPSAVLRALRNSVLSREERAVADLLEAEIDARRGRDRPTAAAFNTTLEEALRIVRKWSSPTQGGSSKSSHGKPGTSWQIWRGRQSKEESIAALEPPFIAARGFHDGLDQLPFVADLAEMQGRSWHPEGMLTPEVRLLRAIHEPEANYGALQSYCSVEHLAGVRQIRCEVLANQFLELNNIRKDGPGDLGSWFWKIRFYARSEEAMAQLAAFDRGAELGAEAMEAVRWLGLRAILQWAGSKVVVGTSVDGRRWSLWEHSWALSGVHKSGVAGAILAGCWPESHLLSWCTLEIGLTHPQPGDLDRIRELVEVEYPLGNELHRSDVTIQFTFPELASVTATSLLDALRLEITRVVGRRISHK